MADTTAVDFNIQAEELETNVADIVGINKQTFGQKLKSYTRKPTSLIMLILVIGAAVITLAVLIFIIAYILINGVPNLSWSLFQWNYNSENSSMMPAIINTVIMTILALLISVPFGIGAAVYLVEYAKRGNKLVGIVRITAETLTGIPSIVYGLFGMLFFVTQLKWRLSMLAGAFTLAIMILPVIMRTTEEALMAVPDSYREGSFGLGRIVGETAALMYTAGTVPAVQGLLSSGRTLAVHMYVLSSEGLYMGPAYATAVILLVVVLLMNLGSSLIAKRLTKGN